MNEAVLYWQTEKALGLLATAPDLAGRNEVDGNSHWCSGTLVLALQVLTMLEPSEDDPVSPVSGKRVPRWLLVSGEQESTVSTEQLLGVIKIPAQSSGATLPPWLVPARRWSSPSRRRRPRRQARRRAGLVVVSSEEPAKN